MVIAVVCTALLGALLFGLGMAVSLMRGKHKQLAGYPTDPTHALHKLVRAHGNTAEYAPFLAALFLYLGAHGSASWVAYLIGAATFCRLLVVVGILLSDTLERPHPLRFLGALGTYLAGLGLCVALVIHS